MGLLKIKSNLASSYNVRCEEKKSASKMLLPGKWLVEADSDKKLWDETVWTEAKLTEYKKAKTRAMAQDTHTRRIKNNEWRNMCRWRQHWQLK